MDASSLPEEISEASEAFIDGYKTIPEISRERIRRAGDKIASEHPDAKVLRLSRRVSMTPITKKFTNLLASLPATLLDTVDTNKDDRSDLDLAVRCTDTIGV